MRIEQALVAFLRADPGVRALTGDGKRIYKGPAKGDADCPRLHYWLVTEADYQLLDGKAAGQPQATIRLECVGRGSAGGYEDARALGEACESATGGVRDGQRLKEYVAAYFPPGQANRLWVQAVRVQERQAGEEEMPAVTGTKAYFLVALDVIVNYVMG